MAAARSLRAPVLRSALLALIATVAVAATPPLAASQEPPEMPSQEGAAILPDIEDEVMCPVCGTALNLAESPQAKAQREFIRARIAEGLDKEQIKERLVDEYGTEVLALPSKNGFDLTAWVVPGLAVIGGGTFALVGLRRWRRHGAQAPITDSEVNAPTDSERDQLEQDLARYRL